METLFLLLIAVLEVYNRFGFHDIESPEMMSFEKIFPGGTNSVWGIPFC